MSNNENKITTGCSYTWIWATLRQNNYFLYLGGGGACDHLIFVVVT